MLSLLGSMCLCSYRSIFICVLNVSEILDLHDVGCLVKIFNFLLDFLQSCKHESWVGVAKYLMDDVPLLLQSEEVKDIQDVLSVVIMSLPSNFEDFIKWVAEVRRREDGSLSTEEKARLAVKVF